MSSKRLESLSDFSRHHYRVRIDCGGCRKVAIMDPLALLDLCRKRGWGVRIEQIEARLRCGTCGSKRVRVGPGFGA